MDGNEHLELGEDSGSIRTALASAIAKSARLSSSELFIQLISLLKATVPSRVVVRKKSIFNSEPRKLEVVLGDAIFELTITDYQELKGVVCQTSRGIKLKSEPVTVEEWLRLITTDLEAISSRDESVQQALMNWLSL